MRRFEFCTKDGEKVYEFARIPEYSTSKSGGADFFCAEEVVIPPVTATNKPVLVHTGIKAIMEDDEILELYNRSSNPMKLGLVLANSVGIVDADYYGNPSNDGEIMFCFYNFSNEYVTIRVGDRIGQGVFKKFLRPDNSVVSDNDRRGGFGSTGR